MTPADMIALVILSERRSIDRGLEHAGVAVDDRDDLAQEVALLGVQAAQDDRVVWQERAALTRWLYVVALRHGLAFVGRAARRELPEPHPDDARTVPSAEDVYIARETLAIAARAAAPADWRCLRAWVNGVPVADIARRERLTVPGVYSRIERARREILKALRRR